MPEEGKDEIKKEIRPDLTETLAERAALMTDLGDALAALGIEVSREAQIMEFQKGLTGDVLKMKLVTAPGQEFEVTANAVEFPEVDRRLIINMHRGQRTESGVYNFSTDSGMGITVDKKGEKWELAGATLRASKGKEDYRVGVNREGQIDMIRASDKSFPRESGEKKKALTEILGLSLTPEAYQWKPIDLARTANQFMANEELPRTSGDVFAPQIVFQA